MKVISLNLLKYTIVFLIIILLKVFFKEISFFDAIKDSSYLIVLFILDAIFTFVWKKKS